MKLFIAVAFVATGIALPAGAQCLDETVLSRGLTVRYDTGDETTIRRAVIWLADRMHRAILKLPDAGYNEEGLQDLLVKRVLIVVLRK